MERLFAVFFMYLTLSFVAGHVFGLDMYFVWTTLGYVIYWFVVVFSFINMCFSSSFMS